MRNGVTRMIELSHLRQDELEQIWTIDRREVIDSIYMLKAVVYFRHSIRAHDRFLLNTGLHAGGCTRPGTICP